MDMDFSPEDLAFREEVRAFLAESLPEHLKVGARRTPGVFVEPDIGLEWHKILYRKGWVAPHWPKADGGTGWSPTQRFIFEKECALAGAPALSILGLRLVGPVICHFGTQEQKDRFLPGILAGEVYWCQGYSEPAARLEGDEYVINGSKIWTTHAHHADWIFALTRTNPEVKKQAGITFLLVPMDQPGVEFRRSFRCRATTRSTRCSSPMPAPASRTASAMKARAGPLPSSCWRMSAAVRALPRACCKASPNWKSWPAPSRRASTARWPRTRASVTGWLAPGWMPKRWK